MVLHGNCLPSTLLVSFTYRDSHRFNISPLLHSSKSLGTGSPCSSHQLHQDWKLHKHQIVFCSVLFGTNPFEISFSSESDVTSLPNLLITSLITFLFFTAAWDTTILVSEPLSHASVINVTPSVYLLSRNFLHFCARCP